MLNQLEKQSLADKEIRGFVNLLKDSEEKILNLMAQQLSKLDDKTLKAIERLTMEHADKTGDEQVIGNWQQTSKIALMERIQEWKKNSDLEKGMFLISRLKNPGLEEEKYKSILDNYAARIMVRVGMQPRSKDVIEAINEVLFREEAFIGNQVSYYNIDNNFLHTVLETRTGNPIMMSTIYILVARRVGIDIKGVGTPGHFIVQFEDKYYDPFFGGKEITKNEIVLRAQELNVFWRDEYLDPIDDGQVIARCIRNLIAIYKKLNQYEKAADATSILRLV